MRLINSDSQVVGESGENSAQVIQIDSGKHIAVVALCAAICSATLVLSIWAVHVAGNAETEARMVEYFLQDPNSRTPDELASWAEFRKTHPKQR
jgi:hypothetical protein